MKFHLLGKDWKQNWENKEFQDSIAWCKKQGLGCRTEVSGDEFGVDMDFLVFTEKDITDDEAFELVQLGFVEVQLYENEEFDDVELLKDMIDKKRNGYDVTIIRTKDDRIYEYVYPTNQ